MKPKIITIPVPPPAWDQVYINLHDMIAMIIDNPKYEKHVVWNILDFLREIVGCEEVAHGIIEARYGKKELN